MKRDPQRSGGSGNGSDPKKQQQEEIVVDVKEPFDVGEIEKVLGAGGFNCVFLLESGLAHRIRMIKTPEQIKTVIRGANVLKYFNQYKLNLGPGVIQTYSEGQFTKKLTEECYFFLTQNSDSTCTKMLVDNFDKKNHVYFEQLVEYIPGNDLKQTLESITYMFFIPNAEEIAFMLIWFLQATQTLFQFQHRDIKPGNVMLKKLDFSRVFHFKLNGEKMFKITTEYIPYLLDYDQGTFSNSATQLVPHGWTPWYTPPELFVQKKVVMYVYDWFSMGLTLLELWTNNNVAYQIAMAILNAKIVKNDSDYYFNYILCSVCIQTLFWDEMSKDILEGFDAWMGSDDYMYKAKALFTTDIQLKFIVSQIGNLPKEQFKIIKNMLHPIPKDRHVNYLEHECFKKFILTGDTKKIDEDYIFPFNKTFKEYDDMKNKILSVI